MLAIITGTIKPPMQMNYLSLRDADERFKQYEEGLRALIESRGFAQIIFCENSNYGVEKLSYLQEIAAQKHVRLELLSFQGNLEKACIHGKGFGEGEIMDYVFSQSRLISKEPYFIKITGRLKVDNIKGIIPHIDPKKTYFNVPNRTRRDVYDTRMYGMPTWQFKKLFLDVYERVEDEKGIFLETVYTQVLRDNQVKVTNFPRYPRITGVSGSGGCLYSYTEWKCKIRDIFSLMNLYRIK